MSLVIRFEPGLRPVFKHQEHDQSSHGNWAEGSQGSSSELSDDEIRDVIYNSKTVNEMFQKIAKRQGKSMKPSVANLSEDEITHFRGVQDVTRDAQRLLDGKVKFTEFQTWGQGIYIAEEKDIASNYGTLIGMKLDSSAKIVRGETTWDSAFDVSYDNPSARTRNTTTSSFIDLSRIETQIRVGKMDNLSISDMRNIYWAAKGYDGYSTYGETVLFNGSKLTVNKKDIGEAVRKHAMHDQKTHGSWAGVGGMDTEGKNFLNANQIKEIESALNKIPTNHLEALVAAGTKVRIMESPKVMSPEEAPHFHRADNEIRIDKNSGASALLHEIGHALDFNAKSGDGFLSDDPNFRKIIKDSKFPDFASSRNSFARNEEFAVAYENYFTDGGKFIGAKPTNQFKQVMEGIGDYILSERVNKHQEHDQSSHGNWASGGGIQIPNGWTRTAETLEDMSDLDTDEFNGFIYISPNGKVKLTNNLQLTDPKEISQINKALEVLSALNKDYPDKEVSVSILKVAPEDAYGASTRFELTSGQNPRYFDHISISRDVLSNPTKSGIDIEATLIHEWGHVIDTRTDSQAESDFVKFQTYHAYQGFPMTSYGMKDKREVFAETFMVKRLGLDNLSDSRFPKVKNASNWSETIAFFEAVLTPPVRKHQQGTHDQRTHGSWAGGGGAGVDITEALDEVFFKEKLKINNSSLTENTPRIAIEAAMLKAGLNQETVDLIDKMSEAQIASGQSYGDNALKIIAERQGFTDKPKVVQTIEDLEEVQRNEGGILVFRGISDYSREVIEILDRQKTDEIDGGTPYKQIPQLLRDGREVAAAATTYTAEQAVTDFTDGEYFGGWGVFGNGTYTTVRVEEASTYADLKDPEGGKMGNGKTLAMLIPRDAKAPTKEIVATVIKNMVYGGEPNHRNNVGRMLASMGYQYYNAGYVQDDKGGIFVVLDRSMLTVAEKASG